MEDLKKNVKELEQKLDTNVELILSNMRKLHKHDEQIQSDVESYIKLAHAWIDDVDAQENKVWWYFIN